MPVHKFPAELSLRNFILKLPEGEKQGGKNSKESRLCLVRLHRSKDELAWSGQAKLPTLHLWGLAESYNVVDSLAKPPYLPGLHRARTMLLQMKQGSSS